MTVLRGAIDFISPTRISGWIYSEYAPVTGLTALALLDGQCVGAGQVQVFRPDLAGAGLGDGQLGFDIQISIKQRGDEGRVLIKLDGSDAVLLQSTSRVERADAGTGAALPSFRSMASLEWMRGRGWLEQTEIDLFKSVEQFGVYDRSLRLSKVAEKLAGTPLMDAQAEAKQLLELLRLKRIELRERRLESLQALVRERREMLAGSPEPVIALWGQTRSVIMVVEGSHRDGLPADHGLEGAIDYAVGPDRLLLLDLRCRFAPRYMDQTEEVRAYLVAADKAA
jgi:hypothetical protein